MTAKPIKPPDGATPIRDVLALRGTVLKTRGWSLAEKLEFYSDPHSSGCILWRGYADDRGYGVIYFDGLQRRAHRASWMLHKGAIPKGLCVCHKCDVPSCINPDHLFLGTDADNVADRDKKGRGRGPRGEACARAKLTNSDIAEIRNSSAPSRELAKQFAIAQGHVWRIKTRKVWGHIA